MTDPQLADLSAVDLLAGYRRGDFTPVEVADAVIDRVERLEPSLHALYAFDPDRARAAAKNSAARWHDRDAVGSLDGIPITIKENIATEGIPVPLGTAGTVLAPATGDAPPAARVREAGSVLVAKTTMPDFGMLTSGLSSFHPLTRNPWGLDWTPGGSSAGGAAAAAAAYGPLHVGTDIGGSLRLPASFTGTVTLKPSLGRVPIVPPYFGRVAGPLTRTVADTALLMATLSQPDWRDHMSLPYEELPWLQLDGDVSGLRVGLLLDAGCGLPVDADVARLVREAGAVFTRGDAVVEEISPFFTRELLDDLDRFWRARGWVDFSALPPDRQDLVLPYIADWCRSGAALSGEQVLRAVNSKLEIRARTVAATQPYDLVLSPVSPVAAFAAELASPINDPERPFEHIAFTVPYNMSEQPASSINCGFTAEGKPVGLQIAGRRFDDIGVLRATAWYERARPASAVPDWSRLSVR